jgi:hypothetical protein
LKGQASHDEESSQHEDRRERGVSASARTLGRQGMFDRQAQVILAPVIRGRFEDQLAERPPAGRQIAERPEDAKHGIGLGCPISRDLGIAEDAERQIHRPAEVQRARRYLLVRMAPGRVEPREVLDIEAAEICLGIRHSELILKMLSRLRTTRAGHESLGLGGRGDLEPERLVERDRRQQVLGRRDDGGIRPWRHDLDQLRRRSGS